MNTSHGRANLVFGTVVFLLAGVAAVSMYVNRNLPVIREAPGAGAAAEARLPENHPPIEMASQAAALEQRSRSEPENAEVKIQLGNVYYDLGQYQKASEAYEAALKLSPRNAGVETDLATCYHELGAHDKALAALDRVLQYQPGFAQALFNKGIVLQRGKNDVRGAIAAWEKLLQTNPDYPQKADVERRLDQLKAASR
jgi:cytochrome c-type biogenesis protein CcmH/NrfG